MGAVTCAITRRDVFQPRVQRVGAAAGCRAGKVGRTVVACADQLVVAHRCREALAGDASAFPLYRRCAVGRDTGAGVGHRVARPVDLVAKRRDFRPDAGVDDADDDVLALDVAGHGVELRPQPTGGREAQEAGRAGGVDRVQRGLDHRRHAGGLLQLLCLRVGQLCREAVEGVAVVVQRGCPHACLGQLGAAPHRQVVDVSPHIGCRAVELGATGRPGGGDAADAAGIGGSGCIGQLDDVDLLAGGLGLRAQAQGKQPCGQRNS